MSQTEPSGVESDWIPIHDFVLTGTRVWVGDAQFAAGESDGAVVDLPSGQYQALVKEMAFGTDVRYSRLRLVGSSIEPDGMKQIGETWADTATQGICDFDLFAKLYKENPDEVESLQNEIWDQDPYGVCLLAGQAELIVVQSGFGDGTFALYELLTEGRRVGLEVEMIAPGAEYPF